MATTDSREFTRCCVSWRLCRGQDIMFSTCHVQGIMFSTSPLISSSRTKGCPYILVPLHAWGTSPIHSRTEHAGITSTLHCDRLVSSDLYLDSVMIIFFPTWSSAPSPPGGPWPLYTPRLNSNVTRWGVCPPQHLNIALLQQNNLTDTWSQEGSVSTTDPLPSHQHRPQDEYLESI